MHAVCVGAAAAAVIGIALIAVAAWLIIRRRRRQMLADLQADMHKVDCAFRLCADGRTI